MMNIELSNYDIFTGDLILVNSKYPYHIMKELNLQAIPFQYSEIHMEERAAKSLNFIFKRLNCYHNILPVSGYRTQRDQVKIYQDSIQENGLKFTKKYVALPNQSEHQTGLAIDLGLHSEDIDFIRPEFPYEGVCEEFRRIAPDYGFIQRYQEGKEHITKIAHEPWHFRYVGFPHSIIITHENMSLEEYIEFLTGFELDQNHFKMKSGGQYYEIAHIPNTIKSLNINLPDNIGYTISGTNVNGYILTMWRKM